MDETNKAPEHKPLSIAESIALPEATKLELLKNAKMGAWYDGWRPYCGMCNTMSRMTQHDYGFQCRGCRNQIGWDLTRLKESPINANEKTAEA